MVWYVCAVETYWIKIAPIILQLLCMFRWILNIQSHVHNYDIKLIDLTLRYVSQSLIPPSEWVKCFGRLLKFHPIFVPPFAWMFIVFDQIRFVLFPIVSFLPIIMLWRKEHVSHQSNYCNITEDKLGDKFICFAWE